MNKEQDDLYVEIEYTPTGSYNWHATLRSDSERYIISTEYSDFKWLIHWYARRLLAEERKKRHRQQRAREYGKQVVR